MAFGSLNELDLRNRSIRKACYISPGRKKRITWVTKVSRVVQEYRNVWISILIIVALVLVGVGV